MRVLVPGRVCYIVKGRHAGKKVVVTRHIDNNYVEVAGVGIKRRKINILHLSPSKEIEMKEIVAHKGKHTKANESKKKHPEKLAKKAQKAKKHK